MLHEADRRRQVEHEPAEPAVVEVDELDGAAIEHGVAQVQVRVDEPGVPRIGEDVDHCRIDRPEPGTKLPGQQVPAPGGGGAAVDHDVAEEGLVVPLDAHETGWRPPGVGAARPSPQRAGRRSSRPRPSPRRRHRRPAEMRLTPRSASASATPKRAAVTSGDLATAAAPTSACSARGKRMAAQPVSSASPGRPIRTRFSTTRSPRAARRTGRNTTAADRRQPQRLLTAGSPGSQADPRPRACSSPCRARRSETTAMPEAGAPRWTPANLMNGPSITE